jgi:hypothetical protein
MDVPGFAMAAACVFYYMSGHLYRHNLPCLEGLE